jgi:hypothetical protein
MVSQVSKFKGKDPTFTKKKADVGHPGVKLA